MITGKTLVPIILAITLILHFFGGTFRSAGVPVMLILSLIFVLNGLKKKSKSRKNSTGEDSLNKLPIISDAEKKVVENVSGVDMSVIGMEYRKKKIDEFEKTIDRILDKAIKLIRSHFNSFTVAVFFPETDGGYKIRKYLSKSEFVNKGAVIKPGVGVIGSFFKDGQKKFKLNDIASDSTTLFYYNKHIGVRSLIASPLVADNVERGAVIVDSTEKNYFSDEGHAFLTAMAELIGQAVYNSYLYNQHRLDHERLVAMSNTEKYFLQEYNIDAVLDKLKEIIPFAFKCDRLSISLLENETCNAIIKRSYGLHSDELLNFQFSIKNKSLASVVYSKKLCIFRNFSKERYEIRYAEEETRTDDFNSFFAFPFGVDNCKGMILLESVSSGAYSERSKEQLLQLASSAGVAIEKIQILQQIETLAIRDGLTGLYNHRQFQIMLKEAITRSIRYKKPLALVMCDIDHFKEVNDIYGHRFGDDVLKTISLKLQGTVRESVDSVARYGGEEFALILSETDGAKAKETVERIRKEIAKMIYQTPLGKEIHCTVSFGIALYGHHTRKQELLISRADKALYRAKKNGRNKVELYYDA